MHFTRLFKDPIENSFRFSLNHLISRQSTSNQEEKKEEIILRIEFQTP